MRKCSQIEQIVRAWEEQGMLSAADLALIQEHLHSCESCASKNRPLLMLFKRDASVIRFGHEPMPEFNAGFVDRVMDRVDGTTPRRTLPAGAWAAVAAACLVLAVGIGAAVLRLQAPPPSDEVVVRFELDAPGARSVALVGSFSGWSATRFPMRDVNRDGVWQVDVRLKRDSINTYNFVIDGKRWIVDPRSQAQVDDGFGGRTSVLRL